MGEHVAFQASDNGCGMSLCPDRHLAVVPFKGNCLEGLSLLGLRLLFCFAGFPGAYSVGKEFAGVFTPLAGFCESDFRVGAEG